MNVVKHTRPVAHTNVANTKQQEEVLELCPDVARASAGVVAGSSRAGVTLVRPLIDLPKGILDQGIFISNLANNVILIHSQLARASSRRTSRG